ncbi:MAG: hypothetical protein HQK87_08035 [Nitrospinae bacterium]|nr:hypothetical protein [Nitrospinota bacterium]
MAAQYDRSRNKGNNTGADPLQEVLANRWPRVAAGAGAAFLMGALVYGIFYYLDARGEEAQQGLYKAQAVTPATGATEAQATAGIEALNAVISRGGPDEVMAQAHADLAALHWRAGRAQEAFDEYSLAEVKAGAGTLVAAVAAVGKANAQVRMGRYADAAVAYDLLLNREGIYPKGPLLHALGLTLAMGGKKDEAIKALNRLKAEGDDYLPAEVVDDLVRRIDADEFASLAAAAGAAADAVAPSPLGVHTGGQ